LDADSHLDHLKRAAARRAVEFVEPDMVIGLGTGSTAAFVVEELGRRVKDGLKIVAVPSSEHTAALARGCGIALAGFAEHQRIDLAIDGADEVARGTLALTKGGGGALLREKIVAAASDRFLVVVDDGKLVDRLGTHMKLPVEVTQFGWQATAAAIAARFGAPTELRRHDERPFVTDGGNFILDCRFGPIADPAALECRLNMTVGVVENGLFIGRAAAVIVASESGVEILKPDQGGRR